MAETAPLDWLLIYHKTPVPIGAVGFMENSVVAVVSFFEDNDIQADALVGKRAPSDSSAVALVAMKARQDMNVTVRDPHFQSAATRLSIDFERNVMLSGIYRTYFQRGVSMTGRGASQQIAGNFVKHFTFKKGSEGVITDAFRAALDA